MKNRLLILLVSVAVITFAAFLIIKLQPNSSTADNIAEDDRIKGASTQQEQESPIDSAILRDLPAEEAKKLIADNKHNSDFVILDIRTPQEFVEGHIDGAQNLDFYDNFDKKIAGLDKNKTYLVYCRSGNRSSQASELFRVQGFTEVYEISGGYNKWIQ